MSEQAAVPGDDELLEQVKQDRAALAFAIRQGDLERAQRVLREIDRRMGWA